jgi:hypothetical protein
MAAAGAGNGGNGGAAGGNGAMVRSGNGGMGMGGDGGPGARPPAACMGAADGRAGRRHHHHQQPDRLSLASRDLTPANAPQIVVFGWDDVENRPGVEFVNSLIGGITNPDGKKARRPSTRTPATPTGRPTMR